jgi:predicted ester cyclase
MSVEDNKAVIRRYFDEVVNGRRLHVVDELFAPGYGGAGLRVARAAAEHLQASIPDVRARIDDLIGEGDGIVVKVTCEGTHGGSFLGVPATGRSVRFEAVELARFDDQGRITGEAWHVMDTGVILRQLGVVGGP